MSTTAKVALLAGIGAFCSAAMPLFVLRVEVAAVLALSIPAALLASVVWSTLVGRARKHLHSAAGAALAYACMLSVAVGYTLFGGVQSWPARFAVIIAALVLLGIYALACGASLAWLVRKAVPLDR
jgi:hypothetical protein